MPYLCNVEFNRFRTNTKILKIVTKNVLLGIFRLKIGKTIVIFVISTLEFAKSKEWCKTKAKSNFGPKLSYLSILGCTLEKVRCPIRNQHSRICKNENFLQN